MHAAAELIRRTDRGYRVCGALVLAGVLFATALFVPDGARAQIALEQAIVDFQADDPRREDVEISNSGDETLYVAVTPRLVKNPGEENEERVEIRNPRELGLLASPRKMILEAGQRSLLRLSLLGRPTEEDRIFRVNVAPRYNEFETDQTGVRVVIAYNMLVIARPPDAKAELVGQRTGNTLTLRNEGNSNALLLEGEQCAPSGGDCQNLPTRRMYAGNEWTVTLPYATETSWRVRTPDGLIRREW